MIKYFSFVMIFLINFFAEPQILECLGHHPRSEKSCTKRAFSTFQSNPLGFIWALESIRGKKKHVKSSLKFLRIFSPTQIIWNKEFVKVFKFSTNFHYLGFSFIFSTKAKYNNEILPYRFCFSFPDISLNQMKCYGWWEKVDKGDHGVHSIKIQ